VLFIGKRCGDPQANELRALGFSVTERNGPLDDAVLLQFPVVLIASTAVTALPMITTRLRGKPGFARRVIAARVPDDTTPALIRALRLCGLDEVFGQSTPTRAIAARIAARLEQRPEWNCEYPEIPRTPAA
jgi:hypothetical protein